jgi:hypothetical protein
LVDEQGRSYIYGYVPIVVAKCGVFLKEKGMRAFLTLYREQAADQTFSNDHRRNFPSEWF